MPWADSSPTPRENLQERPNCSEPASSRSSKDKAEKEHWAKRTLRAKEDFPYPQILTEIKKKKKKKPSGFSPTPPEFNLDWATNKCVRFCNINYQKAFRVCQTPVQKQVFSEHFEWQGQIHFFNY